ncbi:hypothetical protein TraAM80_08416 [Trypanosoma rangeli]|uniref:Uncharacterized protein n=1 Tax=Trypanosoma rangeli TaxID=5698 RepID=A0A422N0N6_TRYRA|nr:uncharacterized protein TraAM80_08416 [Trypanosoma rangeli]RNE99027.1 hypothetical protein TraAM80_08416 [Trypanosoma rangeli]|eukprot:RNE99027.1 hypothetical protein TraAM80_08416 [Trypanosoma rangeli]
MPTRPTALKATTAYRRKEKKTKKAVTSDTKRNPSSASPALQQPQQQPKDTKRESLQKALAAALSAPAAGIHSGPGAEVDDYGKGSPTDRLQFGYAPSNAAEAVAFHSSIPAAKWIAQRRKQARHAIFKKQKLSRPNCEPMTSLLKLKQHWRNTAQFVAEVRGGSVGQDSAEELLELFVSQQRVA